MAETQAAQLVMSRTPEKPEVTSAYDAAHGAYSPLAMPAVPASMPLPATPSPFLNLRKP